MLAEGRGLRIPGWGGLALLGVGDFGARSQRTLYLLSTKDSPNSPNKASPNLVWSVNKCQSDYGLRVLDLCYKVPQIDLKMMLVFL